jgi:hypothetical protein
VPGQLRDTAAPLVAHVVWGVLPVKMGLADVDLRVSPQAVRGIPGWLQPSLEFDCPVQVGAANIILIREHEGHEIVVISLWRSSAPGFSETRIAGLWFANEGTAERPSVLSYVRLV